MEWLVREEFATHIKRSGMKLIEPIWKMLLSNKGILPILWELFPGHENLLPAYGDAAPLAGKRWVRKPLLGREGANIRITDGMATLIETPGDYDGTGYVYQAFARRPPSTAITRISAPG